MKIIILFFCLLFTITSLAQSLKVVSGTDLKILGGTIFKTEGFTLTPSADFTISDNTLTKSTTLIHSSTGPYISRVYQFTNNTSSYSGSVQIDYTEGAELNGIAESALTLNVHTGTSWLAYASATRDETNNFVFTNGLSNIILNEFTLADLAMPLPLIWRSFTATKQNKTVLLQWATGQEQNTGIFTIQQSSNGIDWAVIGTMPAAGNSNITIHYGFVHTKPVNGINYYRIRQTDIDNQVFYTNIKSVRYTTGDEPFFIMGNPVTNNVLIIQVNTISVLTLFTADGRILWNERVNTGTKYLDVSQYAKGTYFLKTNSTPQKLVIQ